MRTQRKRKRVKKEQTIASISVGKEKHRGGLDNKLCPSHDEERNRDENCSGKKRDRSERYATRDFNGEIRVIK